MIEWPIFEKDDKWEPPSLFVNTIYNATYTNWDGIPKLTKQFTVDSQIHSESISQPEATTKSSNHKSYFHHYKYGSVSGHLPLYFFYTNIFQSNLCSISQPLQERCIPLIGRVQSYDYSAERVATFEIPELECIHYTMDPISTNLWKHLNKKV